MRQLFMWVTLFALPLSLMGMAPPPSPIPSPTPIASPTPTPTASPTPSPSPLPLHCKNIPLPERPPHDFEKNFHLQDAAEKLQLESQTVPVIGFFGWHAFYMTTLRPPFGLSNGGSIVIRQYYQCLQRTWVPIKSTALGTVRVQVNKTYNDSLFLDPPKWKVNKITAALGANFTSTNITGGLVAKTSGFANFFCLEARQLGAQGRIDFGYSCPTYWNGYQGRVWPETAAFRSVRSYHTHYLWDENIITHPGKVTQNNLAETENIEGRQMVNRIRDLEYYAYTPVPPYLPKLVSNDETENFNEARHTTAGKYASVSNGTYVEHMTSEHQGPILFKQEDWRLTTDGVMVSDSYDWYKVLPDDTILKYSKDYRKNGANEILDIRAPVGDEQAIFELERDDSGLIRAEILHVSQPLPLTAGQITYINSGIAEMQAQEAATRGGYLGPYFTLGGNQ